MRAITAISAVIFLVSAHYDMATSYIVGRVENNDYGMAIAYSTVLIVVMLAAIALFQLLVGKRQLGAARSINHRTNWAAQADETDARLKGNAASVEFEQRVQVYGGLVNGGRRHLAHHRSRERW